MVHETDKNIHLTSAEIASLWSTYMSDSAAICITSHFLKTVEDPEIVPVIEFALNVSKDHVNEIKEIFNKEGYHIPVGFDLKKDVNMNAPRLFADSFYLYFLLNMGTGGLANYGMALNLSTRKDTIDIFSRAVYKSVDLKRRVTDVMLNKGIYIKPPYLDFKEKPTFVEKESFLRGWFGERRTLTTQEVSHLYLNLYNNSLGGAVLIGFSQVATTSKVRDYFIKGHDKARKFADILRSVLTESSLPAPMTWDAAVMNSTTAPYSEKLMMFLVGAITAMGIANYGGSLSMSLRHDIATRYSRMIAETGTYAEDGASIMINHGWFERPPQCIDRENLSKK